MEHVGHEYTDKQLDREITRTEIELSALGEYLLNLQDERFNRYYRRNVLCEDE